MYRLIIFCFLFLEMSSGFAQEINTDPFNNRIIQKYYTKSALTATETQDFKKFKWINYYYIHSFIIDTTGLSNCPLFIPELFDVNDYDSYRLPDRRVTINEPICGIRITLLSQRELDLLIYYNGVLPAPIEPER